MLTRIVLRVVLLMLTASALSGCLWRDDGHRRDNYDHDRGDVQWEGGGVHWDGGDKEGGSGGVNWEGGAVRW
jgi:hypothetical protein